LKAWVCSTYRLVTTFSQLYFDQKSEIKQFLIAFKAVLFKNRLLYIFNTWVVCNTWGSSWSCSYGSWIYNYLCNQCLSPLKLWVQIPLRRGVLDATFCDNVFFRTFRFPPPIKLTATIKLKYVLKVELNTTTLAPNTCSLLRITSNHLGGVLVRLEGRRYAHVSDYVYDYKISICYYLLRKKDN
jgi:hypothetical protein